MNKFSLGGRKSQFLACTAFVAVGLTSPMTLNEALANNECGVPAAVPSGAPQVVACGNIVGANTGVTYQDGDIQDGSLFDITFTSTQVNSGGVLLQTTTANNPFSITIENGPTGSPVPKIVNGAGPDAGLDVSTAGSNSGITVFLNAGSASGSGGARQGIQLVTNGSGSAINLTTAQGTTVSSSNSNGIELETNGGSSITATVNGSTTGGNAGLSGEVDGGAGLVNLTLSSTGTATGGLYGMVSDADGGGNATTTVNGVATGNGTILGAGSGTGAAAFTSGGGNAFVDVNSGATATGTLRGAYARASGNGDATIEIGSTVLGSTGTVSQTGNVSGSTLLAALPVGAFASSSNGDATITAHSGSTVSQIGSTTGLGGATVTKGLGMLAFATGSGDATATSNGSVSATGVGVASIALVGGDAVTNIGGNVSVGGGTGVSPISFLSLGAVDLTVGAMAASGVGSATVNIHGGNITNTAGNMPDVGGFAIVLAGTEDATVDVGDGIKQASTINANEIGLFAQNFGSGDARIDIEQVDPEGDGNVVNSGGIGLMASATGGGNADVEARNSTVNAAGVGIMGTATAGNVWIDANDVTSTGDSAIQGFGSQVDIDVHGAAKGAGGLLTATVAGISGGSFSVEVASDASLDTNSGQTGSAISALSGNGISVVNNGTINGNMNLLSVAGNNYVENNSNNSWNWTGFTNLVALGGDNIIENNGTATAGPASLTTFISTGNSIVSNNAGANFNAYGLNGFLFLTGGDAVFNNSGNFNATGLSVFAGLDTFNADGGDGVGGTIDMRDGDTLDGILMIGTNYNTEVGADLYIDADLRGIFSFGGDYMSVGSVTGAGSTFVRVADLNLGVGEYNPYGFAIVGVEDGDADVADFRMAGGPVQKGFFSYDVYLDDGNDYLHPKCVLTGAGDCFVIASVEGQRSFELPILAYGAQQMWHTSTGTWSDRTADLRSAFGGTGFGGGGADAIVEPLEPVATVGNVTPGIWGRLFGSAQSRDHSTTLAALPGLEQFDDEINNNFDQRIYGAMAGIDFGTESLSPQGNQAWIFGLYGGYTGSNLDFDASDTDVDYKAGSIGAYVTYLNGGLFVDATIKADFGKMDYNSGGDTGSADFTSVGGVVDAGYRFTSGSGWYFEPKATLAYVKTDFDDLEVFESEVEFNDGESLRGRVGGRVGTAIDRNGIMIEPYVEASVWNEFDGDYGAAFSSNFTDFTPSFDASGVYGEVALGSSFVNVANGWSGFAKGSVQFGEDSALGLTGNLGVRKAW